MSALIPTGSQFALTVGAAAVALTVPAGSTHALITNEDNEISYTTDGTTATAANGLKAAAAATIEQFMRLGANHAESLANFSAIRTGAGSGLINAMFFKEVH